MNIIRRGKNKIIRMVGGVPKEQKIQEHKEFYKRVIGKELRLDSPRDLNEKIHWRIINRVGRREARLADKILVKKYVEGLGIPGLRIPKTLAVYKDVGEIDLDKLPERFVLKCNHFSGDVFICKDKAKFDLESAKQRLDEVLKKDFSKINLEYHYHYITPRVMAEEYLDDGKNKNPVDYKFYCFEGEPKSIMVCSGRDNGVRFDDFDLEWNSLDFEKEEYKSKKNLRKPENLDEMIRIVKKLAKGMEFVRVDLYEIGGEIYFGEYTFTPGAGIIVHYKQDALDYLGDKLKI